MYVEITTSGKDLSYDSSGFAFMTRTFKVWDISPTAFFSNISAVTNASGVPLPEHGSVFLVTTGPSGTVGADNTPVDLFLWKYTLHPIDATVFLAVAHYTNDPKQAPLGQDYRSSAQYAMVNIPYARRVPVIVSGSSGGAGALLGYNEASVPIRMPIRRITQTVTVQRSLIPIAESFASNETGNIHEIGTNGYCKFECMEVSLRSPQFADLRYNWVWEAGIKAIFEGDRFNTVLTDNGAGGGFNITDYTKYPQGWMQACDARLGTASRHVLFPYHTIEMTWAQVGGVRAPVWFSRLPYTVDPNGGNTFVGAEKFEWNL